MANTPNIGPYTELKPFRFWCQKVLPLVYDESLSYYELLCKVVDYLNKTMEDVDQMIIDMGGFQTAYGEFTQAMEDRYTAFTEGINDTVETLESFVNNYFDNLNVQDEIDHKIDEMAEQGYFDELFGRVFSDELIAVTRTTLSQWLYDNIVQETGYVLDKSLTVENAAADARVSGSMLLPLFNNLYPVEYSIPLSAITANTYWNCETDTAVLTSINYWQTLEWNVKPGEVYKIGGCQGNTAKTRLWILTDNDYAIIDKDISRQTASYEKHEMIVTIPEGATKLLGTFFNVDDVTPPRRIADKLILNVPQDHGDLSNLTITDLKTCLNPGWYRSGALYASNVTDLPVDFDNQPFNLFVIKKSFAGDNFITQYLITATGKSWIRTLNKNNNQYEVYFDWTSPRENYLYGKKLSLLGDSISAYTGTIPAGYDAYYTGSNSGVTNASQMWWSVLCKETGLVPLIINGYSGSGITQLEDAQHVDKIPMSSDERCSGLNDGTTNPDIIIIAGGVNDYTYAQSAQSEPLEWDGKTTPVLGNSFTEAYACMIKKLQTNYPNAIIVALSTWFTMRGTDNGYTLTHTVGSHVYTQADYNKAIENVCKQMHIPYIDVSNIGINRNNMYPTYAIDSSTIPTHPNAKGQQLMGKAIANKLAEAVKAYLSQLA